MKMMYQMKNNNKIYWINLNRITFLEQVSDNEIYIHFVSGDTIILENLNEYQKLLIAIERENI